MNGLKGAGVCGAGVRVHWERKEDTSVWKTDSTRCDGK